MRRLCVMGLGYIGLPTAAMLAARGHAVLGCDTEPRVVAAVASGQAHFREPDLDMLLAAALATGRLEVSGAPGPAEVFLIAVPTPLLALEVQRGERPGAPGGVVAVPVASVPSRWLPSKSVVSRCGRPPGGPPVRRATP